MCYPDVLYLASGRKKIASKNGFYISYGESTIICFFFLAWVGWILDIAVQGQSTTFALDILKINPCISCQAGKLKTWRDAANHSKHCGALWTNDLRQISLLPNQELQLYLTGATSLPPTFHSKMANSSHSISKI